VVVGCGPCLVLDQWLCVMEWRSCVVLYKSLYISGFWTVSGTRKVAVL
jgi:hypothetical protein